MRPDGDVLERRFDCPCCGEPISMLLDLSSDGEQDYIEDCEVCCRPIQLRFVAAAGGVRAFSATPAG